MIIKICKNSDKIGGMQMFNMFVNMFVGFQVVNESLNVLKNVFLVNKTE